MSVILSRDAQLYLSTVDISVTSPTTANTTKVSPLAGFKLTQVSVRDTYSTFRQGNTPTRVDKRVVDDLNLVNLEFTTYAKSKLNAGNNEPADKILWDALTNNGTTSSGNNFDIDFLSSSTHLFPDLFIYLEMNSGIFIVKTCYVESVNVNFEINGIVSTDWKIKAVSYEPISAAPSTFLDRTEASGYLKGRLSTISFTQSSISYTMAMLRGSVTIKNKVVKLSTPIVSQQIAANLRAVVEQRSVEGLFEVYLRQGTNKSLQLLQDRLNTLSTINDTANIVVHLGGDTGKFVRLTMPTTLVQLPEINIRDVVSTSIKIFPNESTLGANDDITLRYTF